FFFLHVPPTPVLSTLSLHDALPIFTPAKLTNDFFLFEEALRNGAYVAVGDIDGDAYGDLIGGGGPGGGPRIYILDGYDLTHGGKDRKSTRLNSSHVAISYAVFCLKK